MDGENKGAMEGKEEIKEENERGNERKDKGKIKKSNLDNSFSICPKDQHFQNQSQKSFIPLLAYFW